MHTLLAFLLAAALLLGKAAGAASPAALPQEAGWELLAPPVFHHLTPTDGLPYPVALGVSQDRHGFMWFATPGGVARWDGYHMRVFRHDSDSAGSLPEDIVTGTATDAAGRVWFGTGSGVVFRFDDATERFVAHRNADVSMGRANGLVADGAAGMWVAGRQGLFHLDAADGRWRQSDLPPGEAGSVLVDRAGRVWVGMSGAILRRDADGAPWATVATVPEGDTVSALFEDGAGTLWFGTQRGRVGRLAGDPLRTVVDPRLGFPGYRVTAFAEAAPGVLWMGSYGDGLRELRRETDSVRRIVRDPTSPTSLGDNSVTGLLVDRSGMVWVSSLRGVHRHLPTNPRVMTIIPHRRSGLPGVDVRAVTPAADGGLWLGFRYHGVARLGEAPGDRWPSALPEGPVQAIADPGDGSLWVGQTGGLSRIDLASGAVTPYAALDRANVWALDLEGETLWAGSSQGLARISLADGSLRTYRYHPKDPHSLSDNQVTALARDGDGRLWVGTYRGLNLLTDPEAGTFQRHLHVPGDASSLPGDLVTDIVQDSRGRLWASTSNGIGILPPAETDPPRFARVGRAQGLRSGSVLSLVEAEDGTMVAGTGDGLAVVDPDTRAVRILGVAEGVEVRTFWSGAAGRLADGTLALGAFGGLVAMRPAPLPEWSYRPPLVVTGIVVDDRPVLPGEDIVVGPSEDRVQVDFAALDYSNPGLNRYAYRLDDGPTVQTDALHRRAVFTNLPPGLHRLVIEGTGSSGLWSEPVHLSLRVLPAWHETAWFRLSGVAAIVLAVVGLLHWRKRQHLRREAELARLVEAKTVEAAEATRRALAGEEEARRALEVVEAAHRAKSRFLAVIAHEIRTPLNGLLGMLQAFDGRSLDRASAETLRTALTAGDTLRSLVDSVLEYGREGADEAAPVLEDVAVRELAAQVVDLLRSQAAQRGLDVSVTVDEAVPERIRADRPLLSRVLINLLGNGIKFTERGGVRLVVGCGGTPEDPRLTLRVCDTGIGIRDDLRDAVFRDFVQADDRITRRFGGVGLGLALARRMAERMGGTLVLEETSPHGSVFRLDIPAVPAQEVHPAAAAAVGEGVPLRLLVVDDDEVNRAVARLLLSRLGHRPHFAADGTEALAAVEADDFDAILMDLHMPGMDGVETTRRIRQAETLAGRRRVPILAMTADLHAGLRERFLVAGGDGSLAKPIVLSALAAALAALRSRPETTLDAGAVAQQVDLLGAAATLRLARLFQRTSRQVLHDMDAAAAAADGAQVGALAHRLRSGALTLGLTDLAEVAGRVEREAPAAPPGGLADDLRALRHARRVGLMSYLASLRRLRLDQTRRGDQARLAEPANR